jgi:dTDP-4-dehydrorhamnose 3,5-epimerase
LKTIETQLKDTFIIEPTIFEDSRGFFFESFNAKIFKEKTGLDINFIQDNHSKSSKGTLRGLHFQLNPHAQSKLVRVIKGEILDVAVDIRKNSSTYGKHISIILSEKNKKQLFIPKGFAHGFIVMSDIAEVLYKTDDYYYPDLDSGVIYNDPLLNIDWKINKSSIILSEKDKNLPSLGKADNNYHL